jgi:predicted TIM-barrel fold metal-dependent hydrolase
MTSLRGSALSLGLLLSQVAGAQTRAPAPIIDMHLHAHPPEEFLQHRLGAPDECALPTVLPPLDVGRTPQAELATIYFKSRLPYCTKVLRGAKSEAELIARTRIILDRRNITAVASSAFENVQRWRAASPRIISGVDVVDLASLDLALLRRRILSKDVHVIGEVGAQYLGIPPSSPLLEPLFALAEELDVPVGIHVGLSAPGIPVVTLQSFRAAATRPLDLEPVLLKHPKLRLYMMHAGWPMIDETLHLLWSYPQTYVDIAVLDWLLPRSEFHAYLKRLVDAGFGQRIMFGSDQMVWPDAIDVAIENIQTAPFLTEAQKRDIFYNNAARFLRLGPAPK